LIKEELVEIREKYGDERRSLIEYSGGDVSIEDLVRMKITITSYIKQFIEYKTQNRGRSRAKKVLEQRSDFLEHMFVATNHQYMMFFTQKGKCFWMRVYEIPEEATKGREPFKILSISKVMKVKAFICT
jgi:DNA gyrase subunit A